MILGFENIERKRVAAFFDFMNDLLELGEHRLPEEGAADVVDLAVDDVGAHLFVARFLQEVMGQELFVKS